MNGKESLIRIYCYERGCKERFTPPPTTDWEFLRAASRAGWRASSMSGDGWLCPTHGSTSAFSDALQGREPDLQYHHVRCHVPFCEASNTTSEPMKYFMFRRELVNRGWRTDEGLGWNCPQHTLAGRKVITCDVSECGMEHRNVWVGVKNGWTIKEGVPDAWLCPEHSRSQRGPELPDKGSGSWAQSEMFAGRLVRRMSWGQHTRIKYVGNTGFVIKVGNEVWREWKMSGVDAFACDWVIYIHQSREETRTEHVSESASPDANDLTKCVRCGVELNDVNSNTDRRICTGCVMRNYDNDDERRAHEAEIDQRKEASGYLDQPIFRGIKTPTAKIAEALPQCPKCGTLYSENDFPLPEDKWCVSCVNKV